MEAELSAQCSEDTAAVGMGPGRENREGRGQGFRSFPTAPHPLRPRSSSPPSHDLGLPLFSQSRDSDVHEETLVPRETGHPWTDVTQTLLA